jgi:predicted RNA-binding Zn ribbon-like protein
LHLARRATKLQLCRIQGGVEAVETLQLDDELSVLFPIARSAADWLVAADWALLKKCANPSCILWFYDTSKNHSRRWCSMEGCGNRHKVTAHYRKKKKV